MEFVRAVGRYIKNHPWKSIVLLLAVVFLVTLAFTGIRDTINQNRVSDSLDELHEQLTASGFVGVNKSEGCGRSERKFGHGPKRCNNGLNVRVRVGSEEEADEKLAAFAQAIEKSQDYQPDGFGGGLPDHVKSQDRSLTFNFGSRSYRHQKSGARCSGYYSYKNLEQTIDLRFDCDVTSWFVRNVDRGWFGD